MAISTKDVIPLSQARANFFDLAEEANRGAEKILTKNGEGYVALIDSERLDYYHRLERERIHLLLLDEAERGLDDLKADRVRDAKQALKGFRAGLPPNVTRTKPNRTQKTTTAKGARRK